MCYSLYTHTQCVPVKTFKQAIVPIETIIVVIRITPCCQVLNCNYMHFLANVSSPLSLSSSAYHNVILSCTHTQYIYIPIPRPAIYIIIWCTYLQTQQMGVVGWSSHKPWIRETLRGGATGNMTNHTQQIAL